MKDAALSYGEKAKRLGILIHLNTPVDASLITEGSWDEVILAIGAEPIHLSIPGADREHVYNSHDILNGKATASGHVAVIGGGLVGVETAEYLSEQGTAVTVIEMLDGVAKDLGALRKNLCYGIAVHASYRNGCQHLGKSRCGKRSTGGKRRSRAGDSLVTVSLWP